MASIWKGSITFGLVSVPVELKTAVREDHISFRQLRAEDLSPIKYDRVAAADGEPVPWGDIVKGYEYEKGKFVVMDDEDFKAAALESSKSMEILDFVRADEIDPRYFETPYYLVPAKGGEKAYALLREAIRTTDCVGIGKIIMRQKQHIAAIRVIGDAMVLELMRFQDELVDVSDFQLPSADSIRAQELEMAQQLVGSLTDRFDPSKYTDEYRENLMKIIRAKMKGKKIKLVEPEREPGDPKVVDLMERLRQSLAEGKSSGRSGGRSRAARGELRLPQKAAASHPKSARKSARKRGKRSA